MVYTVTLNPALDYLLKIDEIKKDVQTAVKSKISYGGKGINVSVILSRLGVKNSALGFTGGFSGKKINDLMKKQNIETDFIEIEEDTRINVKITGAADFTVNAQGPAITLRNEQELIKKISKIKNGDYLVLSGSIPKSMGNSAYERIIESLPEKSIKLIADTSGAPLKSILKYKPFLIKPNNFELQEISEKELKSTRDIVVAAKTLQKYGAQNVLVSMGKKGMILLDETGDVNSEPVIDGKVKNTTGCGDSAVGGFIAGYIKEHDYRFALKLASICANATAFCDTLASAEQIKALANQIL